MRTGWLGSKGKIYYFGSNGAMQTGWMKKGNKKFLFSKSGVMYKNATIIGNRLYNFGSNGVLKDEYTRNLSKLNALSKGNKEKALIILKRIVNAMNANDGSNVLYPEATVTHNDYTKITGAISDVLFYGEYTPTSYIADLKNGAHKGKICMYADISYAKKRMREGKELDALLTKAMKNTGVSKNDSDRTKVSKINRYIIDTIRYDWGAYYGDSDYLGMNDIIKKGRAVCAGYSEYFYRLCTRAGVRCQVVYGIAHTGDGWGSHAWNRVKINGEWKYIDVTWNDTTGSRNSYYLSGRLWGDHRSEGVNTDNKIK